MLAVKMLAVKMLAAIILPGLQWLCAAWAQACTALAPSMLGHMGSPVCCGVCFGQGSAHCKSFVLHVSKYDQVNVDSRYKLRNWDSSAYCRLGLQVLVLLKRRAWIPSQLPRRQRCAGGGCSA